MEHDDTKGDANDVERSSGGSQVNREGDYHQSQMGPKPTRKHFFSPLDSGYADAVHRDAETVEFTEAEEVRAVRIFPSSAMMAYLAMLFSAPSSVRSTWLSFL